MKKRILSAVLLSGATLGATVSVNAEDYDTKIAAKDNAITNLTSQELLRSQKLNLFKFK